MLYGWVATVAQWAAPPLCLEPGRAHTRASKCLQMGHGVRLPRLCSCLAGVASRLPVNVSRMSRWKMDGFSDFNDGGILTSGTSRVWDTAL